MWGTGQSLLGPMIALPSKAKEKAQEKVHVPRYEVPR
jgi:hypothetical protein